MISCCSFHTLDFFLIIINCGLGLVPISRSVGIRSGCHGNIHLPLFLFLFDLILLKNIRKNLDRRNEMRWCLAFRTNDLLRPMRHRPFIVPRLLVKSAIEIVKSETRFCTISFRPSSWCQISTSDICEAIIFDTRSIDRERDFVLIQSHGMSASVFSPPAIATIIRRCLRPTRWRAFRSKGLLRSAENEQHPRN